MGPNPVSVQKVWLIGEVIPAWDADAWGSSVGLSKTRLRRSLLAIVRGAITCIAGPSALSFRTTSLSPCTSIGGFDPGSKNSIAFYKAHELGVTFFPIILSVILVLFV